MGPIIPFHTRSLYKLLKTIKWPTNEDSKSIKVAFSPILLVRKISAISLGGLELPFLASSCAKGSSSGLEQLLRTVEQLFSGLHPLFWSKEQGLRTLGSHAAQAAQA